MAASMPRLSALRPRLDANSSPAFARGGLDQRASQYRDYDERSSEDAALAEGGTAGMLQTRVNNLKSRAMAQNNPEWDAFFQSIADAGDGRAIKLVGGASPDGSNQLRGLPSSNQITGLSSQRVAGAARPVQGGPYGAPDSGPFGGLAPDRGPFSASDTGPYGDQAPDRGPYNSMSALHGRVRSAVDPQDAWRAKTRQRLTGEV